MGNDTIEPKDIQFIEFIDLFFSFLPPAMRDTI